MKKFNYNDLEADIRVAVSSMIKSLEEESLEVAHYEVTTQTIGSCGIIDPCDFGSYITIKFLSKVKV